MILKGQRKTIEIPVTLKIPADKLEGKPESDVNFTLFVVHYGISKRQEHNALFYPKDKDAEKPTIDDVEFVLEHNRGWRGIQDEKGNEIEFTPENVAAVLDDPDYRKAIVLATIRAIISGDAGIKEQARGN